MKNTNPVPNAYS